MPSISRHNLTLLLLGVDAEGVVTEGLGGMTRLQKYLFLLEKERLIVPSGEGFAFEPYKAGPYSSKLYDDLEFLENLGYVESEITAESTDEETAEIEELSFDDLMGDGSEETDGERYDGFGASDAYEERRFILTEEGRTKVQELLARDEYKPVIDAVRKVKSRFAKHSLSDLLYYVYTKYPEMTVESEIKDKVLRRKRGV
jgi:uncharacterized protein YwgA